MDNKDLEFHYVISYSKKDGWQYAVDVESARFEDGTIYDYESNQWVKSDDDDVTQFDLERYKVVQEALRIMREMDSNV